MPNSPWTGIIRLFPARKSGIQSGDGKTANLFYSVQRDSVEQTNDPEATAVFSCNRSVLPNWHVVECSKGTKISRKS